jgi:membrane-bound lytic murein transglycosylase MltF
MVKLFRRYGDKYSFPYLLLAAQAYQESGLNQDLTGFGKTHWSDQW